MLGQNNKEKNIKNYSKEGNFFIYVEQDNFKDAVEVLKDMHISEACNLLDRLISGPIREILVLLDIPFYITAMPWLTPDIIRLLPDTIGMEMIFEIVRGINNKDTIHYLVEVLDEEDAQLILDEISFYDRKILENILNYPEESAGRLMQTTVISVLDSWNVKQCLNYIKNIFQVSNFLNDNNISEVFIVNDKNQPVGVVSLSKIIIANENLQITTIKDENFKTIPTNMDQEEVAFLFKTRGFLSAPVVNDNNVLVGYISIESIIDVVYKESEEDLSLIAGTGSNKQGFIGNIFVSALTRSKWLSFNLIEAALIPFIVIYFDDVLTKYVILTALIQFVVALGGNTGMQSLSVTMRELTLKRISPSNATKHITRELLMAFINACMLGVIGLLWGIFWGGGYMVAIVAFLAVFVNVILGVIFGTLYPMLFKSFKIDPAVASSVCVTTSNDVLGFFIVLYIAHILLI